MQSNFIPFRCLEAWSGRQLRGQDLLPRQASSSPTGKVAKWGAWCFQAVYSVPRLQQEAFGTKESRYDTIFRPCLAREFNLSASKELEGSGSLEGRYVVSGVLYQMGCQIPDCPALWSSSASSPNKPLGPQIREEESLLCV